MSHISERKRHRRVSLSMTQENRTATECHTKTSTADKYYFFASCIRVIVHRKCRYHGLFSTVDDYTIK